MAQGLWGKWKRPVVRVSAWSERLCEPAACSVLRPAAAPRGRHQMEMRHRHPIRSQKDYQLEKSISFQKR